jgi:hypothetical protein
MMTHRGDDHLVNRWGFAIEVRGATSCAHW